MFRRGHTLIEVLVAMVVITILFVFVTGDLAAVSHQDQASDQTIEIAAANYYLGIMKYDNDFWNNVNDGSGPSDPCGNQLGAYNDSFPTPPAQASWNNFVYCAGAPAFDSPNDPSSPGPLAIQYMWDAAVRPGDQNVADLTVWIRRDPSAPVFEYHSIRYASPSLVSPSPYATAQPSSSPGGSPPPPPTPTPKPTTTPQPSPTPIGI